MPEIIDPLVLGTPTAPRMQEQEITAARRAFATAQSLLAGGPVARPQTLDVGWHGSSVNPESGSFAVVSFSANLGDLIGEVVQITFRQRSLYAYVLEEADVPVSLSVTRRLFLALNRLTLESLDAQVVVVA